MNDLEACSICNIFIIDENCIFCDLCNKWIHFKCSKLDKNTFSYYSNSSDPWFCQKCSQLTFPFCNISNKSLLNLTFNSSIIHSLKFCKICEKTLLINDKLLKCNIGRHYIHAKCSNLKRNYYNIFVNNKIWTCHLCNIYPFYDICNNDLIFEMGFNSSDMLPALSDNQIIVDNYTLLPKIDIPQTIIGLTDYMDWL